jgi:enoyl-[acyl-carrier protein] reductase II
MVQAGQSLLPLRKIEPVKKIIDDIMAEAVRVLVGAPNLAK